MSESRFSEAWVHLNECADTLKGAATRTKPARSRLEEFQPASAGFVFIAATLVVGYFCKKSQCLKKLT